MFSQFSSFMCSYSSHVLWNMLRQQSLKFRLDSWCICLIFFLNHHDIHFHPEESSASKDIWVMPKWVDLPVARLRNSDICVCLHAEVRGSVGSLNFFTPNLTCWSFLVELYFDDKSLNICNDLEYCSLSVWYTLSEPVLG